MRTSKEKMAKARKFAGYDRIAHHNSLGTSHVVIDNMDEEVKKGRASKEELPPPEPTIKDLVLRLVNRMNRETETLLVETDKYRRMVTEAARAKAAGESFAVPDNSWQPAHLAGAKLTRTREALDVIHQEILEMKHGHSS